MRIFITIIGIFLTANSVLSATDESPDLLAEFWEGPMKGVRQIVFAERPYQDYSKDGHWYANFGYYAKDENRRPRHLPGGKLCILDLETGHVKVLLDDPEGCIRDPQVDYDAQKILFSYRQGNSLYYHLFEINVDGSNLTRLTDGNFDDIEPTFLPNGDIIFVSSRTRRWVQCWITQVATMHRCDAHGQNIREISANVEHDNTPWPLPNGQILYTRWEYVDRNQMYYHHLWIGNPDGTRQTVFYGNQVPGIVMIDAKPVPESPKIIASFSPGHGIWEHAGYVTLVDPRFGPDDPQGVQRIGKQYWHRDPWAFSETAFMAAINDRIVLMDVNGAEQTIYQLPFGSRRKGFQVHEPRPLLPREREPVIVDQADYNQTSGTLTLIDVYQGRNMNGVRRGSIKKLLILETLPKPINYTGGMEPLTYGGSFTLERILGTVPVEEDGSAHFELPPLRSVFFIALDEDNRAAKRMQSFTSVMPGESTTCIGCHEERTLIPTGINQVPKAAQRPPSQIEPIAGIPDVIDYPRDIQPIFDKHCVRCHGNERREGKLLLTGDRTPIYSVSYYSITARDLIADGRNKTQSNYPPYSLGSGASRILAFCDGSHYDVKLSEHEMTLLRLWTETGATYIGTYAGLGSGMIGGYEESLLERQDMEWPEMQASVVVLQKRCVECHVGDKLLALSPSDEIVKPTWDEFEGPLDARRKYSRQLLYNLSYPEKSLLLLGPLAAEAGGYQSCGTAVFMDTNDPDYKTVLTAIHRTKARLDEIKRFDMPGFIPRPQYIREMKKFGIVSPEAEVNQVFDVYDIDRRYWESHWHRVIEK